MVKQSQQIPIQLLTGFLGSGKTTLLNKIIQDPSMKGTVLIINEVGEVGIDDKLINTKNPVVLLDSGCICCSVQDSLAQTLEFLINQLQLGELSFNKVIIESTGIADPAPIISLIFDFMTTDISYNFAGTITVVDGVNASKELANNYESVKQIALADKIIITKEDLITPEQLELIKNTALELNPSAEIYTANINSAPIDAFVHFDIYNTPKDLKTIMSWINAKRKEFKLASSFKPVQTSSIYTKLPTHSTYQTVSISFDKPLSRISVINAFQALNLHFGTAILRMKGIFDFGEGYPFVIHGVCGECYPISNLADWGNKEPFSIMVVICSPKIAEQAETILKSTITTIDY